MLRALALVAFLVATSLPTDAQRRRQAPFAQRGDVALVAELAGLDDATLLPLLGGVGVRYRAADRTVLGTSLGLNVVSRESDQDGADRDGASELRGVDFRASAWVEQHLRTRQRVVSPFVGGGLSVGAGRTEQSSSQTSACAGDPACDPSVFRNESSRETITVGGALFVGAEVRVVRGVTLGGAYALGAEYTDAETRFERSVNGAVDADRFSDRGWAVGTSTTRIALSVYF